MFTVLLASYGAVIIAELVGDKTLYTLCAIVSRYRPIPVLVGAAVAMMGKMAVAVLLGGLIASLPSRMMAAISAATFFAMALFLWRGSERAETEPAAEPPRSTRAALAGFTTVFLTEWGDIGQITAALLAARYQRPAVVWLGATAALVTKAVLAMTLGMGLRRWVPRRPLRITAVSLLVVMGALALLRGD
jgi:putative Ca2+/H+ antiporter (TMEM165/GDT1 family)